MCFLLVILGACARGGNVNCDLPVTFLESVFVLGVVLIVNRALGKDTIAHNKTKQKTFRD